MSEIVILSGHLSDGLYISAAAALCRVAARRCEAIPEVLTIAQETGQTLVFVELEFPDSQELIEKLAAIEMQNAQNRIVVVVITPDSEVRAQSGRYPESVRGVLDRPLNMSRIIGILEGYSAL